MKGSSSNVGLTNANPEESSWVTTESLPSVVARSRWWKVGRAVRFARQCVVGSTTYRDGCMNLPGGRDIPTTQASPAKATPWVGKRAARAEAEGWAVVAVGREGERESERESARGSGWGRIT